jgi:hypothetical protein
VEVVDLLGDSEDEEEEKRVAQVVARGPMVRSSSDRAGSGEAEVEDQVLGVVSSSDAEPELPRPRYGAGKGENGKEIPMLGSSRAAKQRQTTKTSWEKLFAGTTTNSNPKATASNGNGRSNNDNHGEEAKRIVKPNYHLASQKELRRLCENYGLGTHGDKGVLSERLQIWISMFK